jgi:hypothetical protein
MLSPTLWTPNFPALPRPPGDYFLPPSVAAQVGSADTSLRRSANLAVGLTPPLVASLAGEESRNSAPFQPYSGGFIIAP